MAALRIGAACEVDLQFTLDGHAVCLHDSMLDRETTGHGRVADTMRGAIERLRQRAPDGAPLQSTPLFLDEVTATVRAAGVAAPALVQLDVKTRGAALAPEALERLSRLLDGAADAFIASAYEWAAVQHVVAAAPGLHAGFDPLAFYSRSFDLDADGYRAIAARTLTAAPGASVYYLEARLILEALRRGVNLVYEVGATGAQVDAWTIDADLPRLEQQDRLAEDRSTDPVLGHQIRFRADHLADPPALSDDPLLDRVCDPDRKFWLRHLAPNPRKDLPRPQVPRRSPHLNASDFGRL